MFLGLVRGRASLTARQATTPLDPRVLDAMLPFMTDQYGNPHSRTHFFGWETEDAVEVARKEVRHNETLNPTISVHPILDLNLLLNIILALR